MIGYVTVGTNDLARAARFYDAIAAEMGTGRMMEFDSFIAWGTPGGGAGVAATKPFDGQPAPVILADVLVYSDDYRIERHVRRPAPAGQRPADHRLLLPPARLLAARRQMLWMTPWSQTADAHASANLELI